MNTITSPISSTSRVWISTAMYLALACAGFSQTVVRGPYLQNATTNSIIVRWRTDVPTPSTVRVGLEQNQQGTEVADPAPKTDHAVTVSGLAPDTRYFYSIVSGAATLAGGADYSFVTSPAAARPVRIWAIGDAGTASFGSTAPAAVKSAYQQFAGNRRTDVWLMLGDNAYFSGTDEEYQAAVFGVFPELLRNTPVWSTIGNHETYAPDAGGNLAYTSIFSLPQDGRAGGVPSGTERYYSFDYANIHFVCLDSELSDKSPSGPMLTWLEEDLGANSQPWTIAFWHSPPYSKGSHDSDFESNLVLMRQNALPILESYGVDLVLGGHSHSYERSYFLNNHYGNSGTLEPSMVLDPGNGRANGTGTYRKSSGGSQAGAVYVVAGSAGQTSGGSHNHPAMFLSLNRLGSLVIDVDATKLDVKFLRETGVVDDEFSIEKGDAPPRIVSGPADRVAVVGQALELAVRASGTPPLQYQWYFGGVALAGGTNRALGFSSVNFSDAGAYQVVVNNSFGTITSAVAVLLVNSAPTESNIAIANHSFEEPAIADGQYIVNNMPGWVGSGSWYPVANPRSDWFVGTTGGTGIPSPINGLNVGGLNTGAKIYQDLAAVVRPGMRYTLSLLVGHRIGVPFGTLTVSLMAGGQVLAEGVPNAPLDGYFVPFQLQYDAPENGPIVGQPLRIQLRSFGTDAQAWFDNFELAASPLAPPTLPSIQAQPLSVAAVVGQNVSFSVEVVGALPLSYQWFFGDVPMAEGTNRVLSLTSVGLGDAGAYQVVVNNSFGSVTSSVANLLVNSTPPETNLAIANHSFEEPAIGDGQYVVNNMPGWVGAGQWSPVANPRNDWFVGTTDGGGNTGAIDGLNVGGLNTGATIFQDLGATVRPGTRYTLSLLAGHRVGVPFGTLTVSLIAGGQVLAEGTPTAPLDGYFLPFQLRYDSPETGSAVGQTLRIQLRSAGGDAQPWFDDIRLVASPLVPLTLPVIQSQPLSVAAVLGQAVSFSVEAAGALPLNYQWYFGSELLPGGTNRTLTLPGVVLADAGAYRVVVANSFGSVTSAVANLVFNSTLPEINIEIANSSFESPVVADGQYVVNNIPGWVGSGAAFSVANPRNDWFLGTSDGNGASTVIDGLNIGGLNTGATIYQDLSAVVRQRTRYSLRLRIGHRLGIPFGTLTVSLIAGGQVLAEAVPAAPPDASFAPFELNYSSPEEGLMIGKTLRIQLRSSGSDAQVWFDDFKLVASSLVPLTVPVIQSQPASVAAILGQDVSFSLDAVGGLPLTYQWYHGDGALAGETNRTLSLNNVGFADSGAYRAVITNSFGSVTSSIAALTVSYPPALVQVGSVDTLALGPVQVPVKLVANGNENAVAFSLNYDAVRLTFVSAELGAGASGGTLLVNDSGLTGGRVGLTVGLPAGGTFAAGTQTVATVTFAAAGVPSVQRLPIQFGDDPVLRQLSDASAGSLAAVFAAGSISVSPTAVQAGTVETVTGGVASLPVNLRALGTENAVSFTLGFDSALLALAGVQAGADLPPDASILVNSSQAGSGRVGVSVALPAGAAFPRGAREILRANFDVATVLQPVTTPVRFLDSPTLRQVATASAQSIPASYGTGSVSVVSVALEADIAPRSTGDQALTVIDWVQAGRFAAALDVVGPGEFQRVDCAPRESRGNGVISVADWVQAGRYSTGLDPITGIGGPSEPSVAPSGAGGAGGGNSDCIVRVPPTNVLPGNTVNIPVQVLASGTENALGFSLVYDSAKLRLVGVTKLTPIGSATLNVNTNQASAGRVGIAFALPTGSRIPAGSHDILLVAMTAAPAVSGTTTVMFGDAPVMREAVSASAGVVSSSFAAGEIVLGPPLAVGPAVSITRSSDSVVIFWSASEAGYELQASEAPTGRPWSNVAVVPIEIAGQKIVTLPRTGSQVYFRLRKP